MNISFIFLSGGIFLLNIFFTQIENLQKFDAKETQNEELFSNALSLTASNRQYSGISGKSLNIITTQEESSSFILAADFLQDKLGEKIQMPILMFHNIQNVPIGYSDQVFYKNSFSPEKLEIFLQFFQKNNIETLTFFDLAGILAGRKDYPKNGVILTFDDGLKTNLHAVEILNKYSKKGVFFVITEKIGQKEYMDWSDIRRLAAEGHEIGSHTISHPNLTAINPEDALYELLESKKIIEENIGQEVISLSYPAGEYNYNIIKTSEKAGYLFGRTIHDGLQLDLNQRYSLSAKRIFPTTSLISLKSWFAI